MYDDWNAFNQIVLDEFQQTANFYRETFTLLATELCFSSGMGGRADVLGASETDMI